MLASVASALPAPVADADASDESLVDLWLYGRSPHTARSYRASIARLRAFVGGRPLRSITLRDLQAFAASLSGAPRSRGLVLAAAKSLLAFSARLGALPFNVGAALRVPAARDGLADRILDEASVARMLALSSGRDHALVRLAYAGGFRVSELVSIRWSDLVDAPGGGLFATVLGKGGRTRTVRVSAATASVLRALRAGAPLSGFVFVGRYGGALTASQARRVVAAVARRAGLERPVSPHFLRHSHASHALDRGARLAVVRDTLGHSSVATTDRYLHVRPGESSGDVLAV